MNDAAKRLDSGRAWDDFCEQVRRAGHLIERFGDEVDALDRAEWYRFMTRLLRNGFERFVETCEPERPRLRDAPWRQGINFQSPDQEPSSATKTIWPGSVSAYGMPEGVTSMPRGTRTETLPEVPWFKPSAFILRQAAMIARRSRISVSPAIRQPRRDRGTARRSPRGRRRRCPSR